ACTSLPLLTVVNHRGTWPANAITAVPRRCRYVRPSALPPYATNSHGGRHYDAIVPPCQRGAVPLQVSIHLTARAVSGLEGREQSQVSNHGVVYTHAPMAAQAGSVTADVGVSVAQHGLDILARTGGYVQLEDCWTPKPLRLGSSCADDGSPRQTGGELRYAV